MKILVLSDSHGAVSPMEQAVEQTSPDLILHLGTAGGTGNGSTTGFPPSPWNRFRATVTSVPQSRRNGCWSCGASVFSCATATPTA